MRPLCERGIDDHRAITLLVVLAITGSLPMVVY